MSLKPPKETIKYFNYTYELLKDGELNLKIIKKVSTADKSADKPLSTDDGFLHKFYSR